MLEPTVTLAYMPRHRTIDPQVEDQANAPPNAFEATPVSAHTESADVLAADQDRVITRWLRGAKRRSTFQSSARGSAPNPDLAA